MEDQGSAQMELGLNSMVQRIWECLDNMPSTAAAGGGTEVLQSLQKEAEALLASD